MKTKQTSVTIDVSVGCGTLHAIITHDNWKPVSVMCHLGKIGTCTKVFMDSLALMATLALKHNVPLDDIIQSVNNHHCSRPKKCGNSTTWSCADGLSKALKHFKSLTESQ